MSSPRAVVGLNFGSRTNLIKICIAIGTLLLGDILVNVTTYVLARTGKIRCTEIKTSYPAPSNFFKLYGDEPVRWVCLKIM